MRERAHVVTMDRAKIRRFVQETLGCGCPEEVFQSIDCKRNVQANGNVLLNSVITVGDRLLIYIVSGDQGLFEAHLASLVSAGKEERDKRGLNRFRLVIVTDASTGAADGIRRKFDGLQDRDENIHLHVISSSQNNLDC